MIKAIVGWFVVSVISTGFFMALFNFSMKGLRPITGEALVAMAIATTVVILVLTAVEFFTSNQTFIISLRRSAWWTTAIVSGVIIAPWILV
ncbi:MAG: hypothetical protein UX07_C0053G0003 [Parcubacteria group bacterium GW2011_GWA2_45_30]|nr:MAG: hypothetical protein UX07_C0053G0003 [Parcubacteria group bacterium GW2011_GWA2_45_30]